MMYLKHKLFGLFFNFFTIFPLKKNRISFITDTNDSFKGNLEYIYNEFLNRGDFDYNFFKKDKFSINSLYKLASSKFVFLNDNFFPIAFMNFNNKTIVSQLWHAPGAFKKFGASSSDNPEEIKILSKISKNIDFLFLSSEDIKEDYQEAFQIDKSKIKSFGVPRIDYYFKDNDICKLREKFNKKYPQAKNKKIILYAPTFRDKKEFNNVFNFFDLKKFNDNLDSEYILAVRFHPKIKKFYTGNIPLEGEFINCTDYDSEQDLLLISDILITDYSSIMIEFLILNKPLIFFTYDLDYYINEDRGFYFNFEKEAPGPIVSNTDDLINIIKEKKFKINKDFLKSQFNKLDGKASERIVNFLLNGES